MYQFMSNAIQSICYGKLQIVVIITKHINMNKSIHDKISHQELRLSLLIVENIIKKTKEHSDKNIGSGI